jgi:hypothetical protein
MDSPTQGGQNPGVPAHGEKRTQLSSALAAAYSRGLLSERSFAARLDCVLSDPVIDPERLIGDLYVRDSGSSLHGRLSRVLSAALVRVEIVLGGPDPSALLGLDWTGTRAELVIGRHPDCDVAVSDSTVSRHHARLRFRDGHWTVEDLDSRNGTSLNGRRVGRCELRPGDHLALGHLALRVD